jgi:hypothetical protein
VANASAPKTRYAINAIAKRLITHPDPSQKTLGISPAASLRPFLACPEKPRSAKCPTGPLNGSTLVHREGFEPSYLARRSRFTVCRL